MPGEGQITRNYFLVTQFTQKSQVNGKVETNFQRVLPSFLKAKLWKLTVWHM